MEKLSNAEQSPEIRSVPAQQRVTDRFLSRWLEVALEHPVLLHFLVPVTLLLTSNIVLLYGFNVDPNMPQAIAIDLLIGVTTLIVPLIITYLLLRREIHEILNLTRVGPPSVQRVVRRLISEDLRELVERLDELQAKGCEFRTNEVPKWVHGRCWATLKGSYIGTDTHLPSKYWRTYRNYLEGHRSYLTRTGRDDPTRNDSVRIIFADRAKIEDDKKSDPEGHREFLKWHKENNVALKILSLNRANKLAGNPDHDTRGARNMACWD